jgi:hypothetical protein
MNIIILIGIFALCCIVGFCWNELSGKEEIKRVNREEEMKDAARIQMLKKQAEQDNEVEEYNKQLMKELKWKNVPDDRVRK